MEMNIGAECIKYGSTEKCDLHSRCVFFCSALSLRAAG